MFMLVLRLVPECETPSNTSVTACLKACTVSPLVSISCTQFTLQVGFMPRKSLTPSAMVLVHSCKGKPKIPELTAGMQIEVAPIADAFSRQPNIASYKSLTSLLRPPFQRGPTAWMIYLAGMFPASVKTTFPLRTGPFLRMYSVHSSCKLCPAIKQIRSRVIQAFII